MGIFNMFSKNINEGVRDFGSVSGAVLLDVRTEEEYREGHIPGSMNVPLQNIGTISDRLTSKDTPVFVYCYSGSRSSQAVNMLKRMGYTNVRNIGGIVSYTGKVVR